MSHVKLLSMCNVVVSKKCLCHMSILRNALSKVAIFSGHIDKAHLVCLFSEIDSPRYKSILRTSCLSLLNPW